MGRTSTKTKTHRPPRRGARKRGKAGTPLIVDVEVERPALGGDGVARLENKVLFVSGGFPGDRARVVVDRHASRFMRGKVVQILRPAPSRRPVRCAAAGRCGGCPWMGMTTEGQLEAREVIVRETLARIGGVDRALIAPIVPAPEAFGYRNRLRLMAMGRRVGFHASGSRRLADVERCEVARPELNGLLEQVRAHLAPFLPLRRPLQIEMAITADGALELALTGPDAGLFETFPATALDPVRRRDARSSHLTANGPVLDESPRHPVTLHVDTAPPGPRGRPRLAFAQANPAQNTRLVRLVHEMLDPCPEDRILDLYAGDGNLTATLAGRVRDVVGIDIDARAVAAANARTGINARYLAGDVPAVLAGLLEEGQVFDRIVLDPPRAGARAACGHLVETGAIRLVYVSCNPATLARDLRILVESGFRVARVTPVDLFPQTAHVECVTVLEKET